MGRPVCRAARLAGRPKGGAPQGCVWLPSARVVLRSELEVSVGRCTSLRWRLNELAACKTTRDPSRARGSGSLDSRLPSGYKRSVLTETGTVALRYGRRARVRRR